MNSHDDEITPSFLAIHNKHNANALTCHSYFFCPIFINYFFFFLTVSLHSLFFFFFFNDPAPPEIYPLPLHDALPICDRRAPAGRGPRERKGTLVGRNPGQPRADRAPTGTARRGDGGRDGAVPEPHGDRKSTRLNSSHLVISYAVFCLKKKKTYRHPNRPLLLLILHADNSSTLCTLMCQSPLTIRSRSVPHTV